MPLPQHAFGRVSAAERGSSLAELRGSGRPPRSERTAHPLARGPSGCEPIGRVGSHSPAREVSEHP
eukprot:13752156-Alexandrium_andersonii.AAC.1